jgi:site-specific DNA-methyltransferase (adenine-specific)
MNKKIDILESIENSICAEDTPSYHSKKLQPFYYNPERKTKIYCGDALDILKRFPDNCVDMIFADPPYFGNQSGLIINRTDGHAETFDTQKAQWAYSKPLAEQFQFHYSWIKEAQRILKDGSVVHITV